MKRKTHFQFKQFTLRHDRCSMKVGTDGVLLGAWVNVDDANYLLDIGTGSGVIALMMAQRTPSTALIEGVEIEKEDATQARENVSTSPWPDRVTIHHSAVQHYTPSIRYDVIVSNPPFFNNSQQPPDSRRHQTRHTISLDHKKLIDEFLRLTTDHGRFNVVMPYTEGLQFIDLARKRNIFCSRQFSFRTRSGKPIERWLLEFKLTDGPLDTGEILLYDEGLEWSTGYKTLTREFYLKL